MRERVAGERREAKGQQEVGGCGVLAERVVVGRGLRSLRHGDSALLLRLHALHLRELLPPGGEGGGGGGAGGEGGGEGGGAGGGESGGEGGGEGGT